MTVSELSEMRATPACLDNRCFELVNTTAFGVSVCHACLHLHLSGHG